MSSNTIRKELCGGEPYDEKGGDVCFLFYLFEKNPTSPPYHAQTVRKRVSCLEKLSIAFGSSKINSDISFLTTNWAEYTFPLVIANVFSCTMKNS